MPSNPPELQAGPDRVKIPKGVSVGFVAGLIVLCGYAAFLLSVEAVTLKVLAAVWLAALPVTGLSATLGYLVQVVLRRATQQQKGGSHDA